MKHKNRNEIYIYDRSYGSTLLKQLNTSSTFHECLPDDDPAGSKHLANVQNKQNINTLILVYLLQICCVDGCRITLYKTRPS
jgi:hypothetical protein